MRHIAVRFLPQMKTPNTGHIFFHSQMFVVLALAFAFVSALPSDESVVAENTNSENFHPENTQEFFKHKMLKKLFFKKG
jgi:hypothetical protein